MSLQFFHFLECVLTSRLLGSITTLSTLAHDIDKIDSSELFARAVVLARQLLVEPFALGR